VLKLQTASIILASIILLGAPGVSERTKCPDCPAKTKQVRKLEKQIRALTRENEDLKRRVFEGNVFYYIVMINNHKGLSVDSEAFIDQHLKSKVLHEQVQALTLLSHAVSYDKGLLPEALKKVRHLPKDDFWPKLIELMVKNAGSRQPKPQ